MGQINQMKVDLSRASLPPEFTDTHIAAWRPVATFAGCSKDHLLRRTLSNAAHAHILVRVLVGQAERPKAPEGGEGLRLRPEYCTQLALSMARAG